MAPTDEQGLCIGSRRIHRGKQLPHLPAQLTCWLFLEEDVAQVNSKMNHQEPQTEKLRHVYEGDD